MVGFKCPSAHHIQDCNRHAEPGHHPNRDCMDRCRYIGPWMCVYCTARHPYSDTASTDGAARIGATVFGELLNAVFANIGQRAIRKVARETFGQLLNMNLQFHLSRQTGGLTRAIDRGTKCV